MLKIKDNVDLKELEKFGFKPKYSEETGELIEYFFVDLKETGIQDFLGIFIVKKDYEKTKLRIKKIFKKDYRGVPLINENKIWAFDNYKYSCTALDKLYDLIKADLVEKVDD